jgi:hypothetical protein
VADVWSAAGVKGSDQAGVRLIYSSRKDRLVEIDTFYETVRQTEDRDDD